MTGRWKNFFAYSARHPFAATRDSCRAVAARLQGRSALRDGLPWMPWPAIAFLRERVEPGMRVFEYGSGGSTLFFAREGAEVVSVEHDAAWAEAVQERIEAERLENVEHLAVLPAPASGPAPQAPSALPEFDEMCFGEYVETIKSFPENHFDLVVVDGRARNSCVAAALDRVKLGGMLVLDNADRGRYRPARQTMKPFSRKVFRGLNPYQIDPGETMVWFVESA